MEKTDIKISSKEMTIIPFGEGIIKISPYIALSDKLIIIKNYISCLQDDSDLSVSYLKAEYGLILGVFNFNTSIDVNNVSVEDLVGSGLWDKVKEKIENYVEFRQQIMEVYNLTKESNNSWKHIFEYISTWVDSQLSSDKLKNLSAELAKETKKIDKYYPTAKEPEVFPVAKRVAKKPKVTK